MGGKKYSVILMRDDDHVRRYRMSSIWFKLGIFTFIFLFFLSAGGIYLGVNYWNQFREVSKSNRSLENEIQSKDVELERLRNMERMVLAHQEEPILSVQNATTSNSTAENATTASSNATDQEKNATVAEKNGTAPANATQTAAPQFDIITPPELTGVLDKGETAISELKLQDVAEGYSIHFMVSNEKSSGGLTGLVSLRLIAKDGTLHTIEASRDALDFTIQRFKTINLTFSVPDTIQKDNVYGLLVKVTNKAGTLIYKKAYPLEDIISS